MKALITTLSVVALGGSAAAQGNGPWNDVCNRTSAGVWSAGTTGGACAISGNGRYVVFESSAALVPGDPGWTDIYIRDLELDTTTIASRAYNGAFSDRISTEPAISTTGRYVAFQSTATNLIAIPDPGFVPDIYLRDLQSGSVWRCSLAPGGVAPNQPSFDPGISGDGRYVSFQSAATNIVAGSGGFRQVYVYDQLSGNVTIASSSATGTPANATTQTLVSALSGDGRYCTFDTFASFSASDTNGTVDVYCKDLVTGQIILVSAHPLTAIAPSAISSTPSISADGRFVAFASGGAFVANDTNGATTDSYVRDLWSSSMSLVSVGTNGFSAGGNSPRISADGKHVAFLSSSGGIVAGDTNTHTDVFVRDLNLVQTTRESVSFAGGDANQPSGVASISANGRRLAFTSLANNLVPGDPQGLDTDCIARDRGPSATPQVFCIAKQNSQGCWPAIGFTGTPSASGANPFHITAANIINQKSGTLFYSVAGPSQIAFQGGWLCVQLPKRAPGIVFSGGSSPGPDCSGVFDKDFYAHIASGADPALVAGQEVWAQYWSRDPADPTTTSLTDGLDLVIGP